MRFLVAILYYPEKLPGHILKKQELQSVKKKIFVYLAKSLTNPNFMTSPQSANGYKLNLIINVIFTAQK